MIAANLDGGRDMNPQLTPSWLQGVGVLFVAFSPRIIAHSLEKFVAQRDGNWVYGSDVYASLGYAK